MYTFESTVRYSECDEQGDLSLLALINYLQDCSIFHSESVGRGAGYMASRNISWLIAAWQIEVARLPRFAERIQVSTWCYSMSHTLAGRNFAISDASGTQLVRADSLWFVYDFAEGRAVRIPEDQNVFLSDEAPLDMPKTKRKLPVIGTGRPEAAIAVNEQHLDTNRHVNNAQYLGMAAGALTSASAGSPLKTTDIARICIQYREQAHLGDVIVPVVHDEDGSLTVDLRGERDGSFAVVRLETREGTHRA